MTKAKHKPKFYMRQSWNNPDWFAICWASNNILVCECPNQQITLLLLNYLNGLSYAQLPSKKPKQ